MLAVTMRGSSLVSRLLSPWRAAVLNDQSAGGYNQVMKRLLNFPGTVFCLKLGQGVTDPLVVPELVPTVAAINGHCFAGGMMLALCCDYRVMTDGETRNAWMCMNEVRAPQTLLSGYRTVILNARPESRSTLGHPGRYHSLPHFE
jgi:hypothetical protein